MSLFDGLLNFYKPGGITSARALDRVRALTGLRKSGHAGTLDPSADGVLLICFGRATRRVEQLMTLPKTYRATGRLDATSPTLDADSPLTSVVVQSPPTLEQILNFTQRMIGEIDQMPPQVSALKVNGVPAYRLARKGQTVDLKPRRIQIDEWTITRYDWPEIDFVVRCGRGTYIRAMIRDLGQSLGTGGILTRLTRVAIGPFATAESTTLDELEHGLFEQRRIPLDRLDQLLKSPHD